MPPRRGVTPTTEGVGVIFNNIASESAIKSTTFSSKGKQKQQYRHVP
jgi:lysylphosphatidylglycerol synthetase-like protein (DUF2156 family)